MKVFLDDLRPCPVGWILTKTATECIALLNTDQVTHLSLDHDLGDDQNGTGYNVVCWIEAALFMSIKPFSPPIMTIHSANPVGKAKMQVVIDRIETFKNKDKKD